MNVTTNCQVARLAHHLWLSAGREYSQTLQFWTMAEQMVWELAAATARLTGSAAAIAAAAERTAPTITDTYARWTRELAYRMWEDAGAQCGRALDHWIAAERHVAAMLGTCGAAAATVDADSCTVPLCDRFSPQNYLEGIRTSAYHMWEDAGGQHDSDDMHFWLAAEQEALQRMEAERDAGMHVSAPSMRTETIAPKTDERSLVRVRRLEPFHAAYS